MGSGGKRSQYCGGVIIMYPIDLFYRAAALYPNHIAVRDHDQHWSYAALKKAVDHLAYQLQQAYPNPGHPVGLCAQNSAQYVIAMLAILAAGKIWVPLNAQSTVYELSRILQAIEPGIIVADASAQSLVHDALVHTQNRHTVLWDLHECCHHAYTAAATQRPQPHSLGPHATQAIKFTGGTTGLPKGVMQTYRSWVVTAINQIMGWHITQQDKFVAAAPLSHGTGTYVLGILAQGGTLIITPNTQPETVAQAFYAQGGTMTFMPPTLIYNLMQHEQVSPADFPNLRLMIYGGAPMPEERILQAQRFFGPVIATTYGQTEAPQIATLLAPEHMSQPQLRASVGLPTLFSEIKIIHPDGRPCPPGTAGEILIRGDLLMSGYWRRPDLTAAAIQDGWLHTGDMGYCDENGFLFIKERLKEVIISGGFNVYPIDVEGILALSEDIQDAAVMGMPDDKWGEKVIAVVQPRPNATVNVDTLKQLVRHHLGPVMTPKEIFIFNELPRSAVGKVLKNKIKATLLERQ